MGNFSNYTVIREGTDVILRFNYDNYALIPSIEDDPKTMFQVISTMAEVKNATKIVFFQKREYEYDAQQVLLLREVAHMYELLSYEKQRFSIVQNFSGNLAFDRSISQRYTEIQNIILNAFRSDPYGAYIRLKRLLRHCHINLQKLYDKKQIDSEKVLADTLQYVLDQIEKLQLIKIAHRYAEDYTVGSRQIYVNIFAPIIKPDFMFTKLMAAYPKDGEVVDSFQIEDTDITVFKIPFTTQYLYHVLPLEFKIEEDEYELLDAARSILSEHKPEKEEFVNPLRMREIFYNIGLDLLGELAEQKKVTLTQDKKESLTRILLRYTVGFGLIEILLNDEDMQDISVNSPQGASQIFIVHGKYGECMTNIIPTYTETEGWATKLRLISGRSLDEADPILDTELELPNARVRVSAVTSPLDPSGLAFSFRRHRDKPWTLPLFIKNKMIDPLGAGLLSFLIDGNRSFLICGTRSSGKSSFLSSLLIEIMRRYRIITIEDTLELPTEQLRELGYNIQSLKVSSALGGKTTEVDPSDGIRSTLRLGDSALIIGEVRSKEAVALYEAMRVGAAANVVAGTIHSDSPYGVFDRVVNDIGVPRTSFKATDVVIIANPIKSADGLHKVRRVTQITEVRKDWTEDPLHEKGFVDLMKYDPHTDSLQPTDALKSGDSDILKAIAANIKEFAGSWDAIWDNIVLRAKVKETLIELVGDHIDLLEAPFVIKANDAFHTICEEYKENGRLDSEKIYLRWVDWARREIRKNTREQELR